MSIKDYNHHTKNKESKRALVVEAAVELLKAEANGGKSVITRVFVDAPEAPEEQEKQMDTYNPVKRYADWIEEALKVKED